MERGPTELTEVYKDDAQTWLTPNKKEQAWRILKGLCPHNQGWMYEGHGHNKAEYSCGLCGETGWY